MLDVMYNVPSDDSIKKFVITKDMVEDASQENSDTNQADLIPMPKKNQAESA